VREANSTHQLLNWRQASGFWRRVSMTLTALSCAGLVVACGEGEKASQDNARESSEKGALKDCIPKDSARSSSFESEEVTRAKTIKVYIDGSQSMAGFNAGATREMRPLGDLIALINATAENYEATEYFSFGRNIKKVSARAIEEYGTAHPYNCKGPNCDNQESRLDTVLNAAVANGEETLSLIITDLWLDNKSFSGSPQVALGQPLRAALQNGLAIGVIGIMSPFDGVVYDVPGVGSYRDAKQLPLYVLAFGPEENVSSFQIALSQSASPSFSKEAMRYSLFSAEPNFPWVSTVLKPIGAGAFLGGALPRGTATLTPQYRISLGTAAAQNGQLGKTLPVGGTLREGLIWKGRPAERTDVWRLVDTGSLASCSPGTWQLIDPLENMWRVGDSFQNATFSFGESIGSRLRPGNVYYLETHLGSNTPTVPNIDNQWLRDWALDSSTAGEFVKGKPERFKTLNLSDLSLILENELVRQTPDGREAISFGFMLKVER